MSELTHDATEDGFHEIQLSGKQLVFLFIVTTTVIVVVFLCGVKVGRGARDAQVDEPEQVTAAAPATQPAPVAAPPATEPPAPAADAQEDLSYPKRLQSEATPQETIKRQEEAKVEPAPAPVPAPAVAPAAAVPTPVATTEKVPSAPPSTDSLPTSARAGTWAIQVIATRDRAIAGSVLKKLAAKGYPAFLVNPSANATPAWYKVQVGRYSDRSEAEKVSLRIKKEEQYQSWITR